LLIFFGWFSAAELSKKSKTAKFKEGFLFFIVEKLLEIVTKKFGYFVVV